MVKQAMQVYAGKITKLNCLKLFGNKPCNTFKKCLLLVNIYQLYSTYNIIYIYIYILNSFLSLALAMFGYMQQQLWNYIKISIQLEKYLLRRENCIMQFLPWYLSKQCCNKRKDDGN